MLFFFFAVGVAGRFLFNFALGNSDLFALWDRMFSMEICLVHRGLVIISLLLVQSSCAGHFKGQDSKYQTLK